MIVDLEDGSYEITSAGHPPALRYDLPTHEWVIDNARGTALGVLRDPELHRTSGRLFPGEALMFYTDGVVESRTAHLDVGIAWLQRTAREAVSGGFPGAAHRVIGQVDRGDPGSRGVSGFDFRKLFVGQAERHGSHSSGFAAGGVGLREVLVAEPLRELARVDRSHVRVDDGVDEIVELLVRFAEDDDARSR